MDAIAAELLLESLAVAASAHGLRRRDWFEDAFHGVLHPLYESPLRGRRTLAHLRVLESNARLDAEAAAAMQWTRLQAMLRHCWDNVPFYRTHWSAAIGSIDEIRCTADLARLPVLTKTHLREHFRDLHARGDNGRLLYKQTDGTTGEPLRFAYTRDAYEQRQAVMHRGYRWAGYRVGSRALYLWWSPHLRQPGLRAARERLHHRLFNRSFIDAMHLDPVHLARYARQIAAAAPRAIVSYVTPLYLLARWALATGTRLHQPEVILTAAEPLEEYQRATIREAFRAPVRNTYGCREFMLIASEHASCGRLHVNSDQLVVESIPLDIAGAQSTEQIVVTDLANRGMPMVRYVNGDVGRLATQACTCGLPFPVIERLDGRRLDMLRTPSGRLIHFSAITYGFLTARGVAQYKVIQRGDRLEVRVVPVAGYCDEVGRAIVAGIAAVIGEPMAIELVLVEQIPPGRNGKFRITETVAD
jgi:phenylacetate-CoA ligase